MSKKVLFNVLARDLNNAKEISALAPERVLVGLMAKSFKTDEEAVAMAKDFMNNGILTSIGLGAGDPSQWKRVADISAKVCPYHINQVFPAAGYTLGRLENVHKGEYIVNALIEPGEIPGQVYISTGAVSSGSKDSISCETAAKMMADIGLQSVKFYPIEGNKKLEHVKMMVRAAVEQGVTIFEATGGIGLSNVHEIVKACLDEGAEVVIPHLYTSLINKETGLTNPEYIKELLAMSW